MIMIARKTTSLSLCVAALLSGGALAGPTLSDGQQAETRRSLYVPEPLGLSESISVNVADSFLVQEQRLQEAITAAEREKTTAVEHREELARFYAVNELYPEALDIASAIDSEERTDALWQLIAEAHFALGRDDNVLDLVNDQPLASSSAGRALKAMSLARLGAFQEAVQDFQTIEQPTFLTRAPLLSMGYLKALSEIETGQTAIARSPPAPAEGSARDLYLSGRLKLLLGDRRGAFAVLGGLAQQTNYFGELAKVELLHVELASTTTPTMDLLNKARRLYLNADGGAFERRALRVIASAASKIGELDAAFAARRQLVYSHPRSDAALAAQAEITEMLATLFSESDDLAPATAARFFYENIEFAPTGDEGDALIRNVADQLAQLDLYEEAAELLEHQVFERLRGAERSTLAAKLASLYFDIGKPAETLRVIRSTRIKGLPEKTNDARRLLEAKALAATSRADDALALLEQGATMHDIYLRADIYWNREEWRKAAKAYSSVVSAASSPSNKGVRIAALRAAAAYSLAGDDGDLAGFAEEAAQKLEGFGELEILEALVSDGAEPDANGAALENFMNSYREMFLARDSSS